MQSSGRSKGDCIKALAASGNNPDAAFEYLMTNKAENAPSSKDDNFQRVQVDEENSIQAAPIQQS